MKPLVAPAVFFDRESKLSDCFVRERFFRWNRFCAPIAIVGLNAGIPERTLPFASRRRGDGLDPFFCFRFLPFPRFSPIEEFFSKREQACLLGREDFAHALAKEMVVRGVDNGSLRFVWPGVVVHAGGPMDELLDPGL